MLGPLAALAKELALSAGRAAAERIAGLVRRGVEGEDDPPQPLSHRHVEHIQAQQRASIEASKKAAREKAAREQAEPPGAERPPSPKPTDEPE